ncbi:MAG TPA: RNA repair domain-containing protein [Methanobacterium sp.]|jgi:hypothetical protein|nr:DUF504 domain-containing protein [Methanobacterium sp.]HOI40257.1 RNA repair domain-containing protein [Methanobacterium sp.]
MAKRVLDMLIWHPEMDVGNCQVTYSHRGVLGNIKTIPAADIKGLEGGFMIMVDGSMVPYHRIVKIECEDKLIWAKNIKQGDLDD